MRYINKIPLKFTQTQSEFFNGLMLGDGSLIWGKKANYPRLSIIRQNQDKDYIFWQYEVFNEFYGTPPKSYDYFDKRTQKIYHRYQCITRSGDIFKYFYEKWYYKGFKSVPEDLILSPLILLIWFLDDGCVCQTNKHSLIIKFSTDGFVKNDVEFLANLLGKYINFPIKVYKNGKNHFILRCSTEGVKKVIDIIEPIFPKCMTRKRTWSKFDFLIKSKFHNRNHISFIEARDFARSLKLTCIKDWLTYCRNNQPLNIPTYPNGKYEEWISWYDWLGYGDF